MSEGKFGIQQPKQLCHSVQLEYNYAKLQNNLYEEI